jgi:hypothetical protein
VFLCPGTLHPETGEGTNIIIHRTVLEEELQKKENKK